MLSWWSARHPLEGDIFLSWPFSLISGARPFSGPMDPRRGTLELGWDPRVVTMLGVNPCPRVNSWEKFPIEQETRNWYEPSRSNKPLWARVPGPDPLGKSVNAHFLLDEELKDAATATANVHCTFPSCLSLSLKLYQHCLIAQAKVPLSFMYVDTAQVVRCPVCITDISWCFEMVSLGITLGLNPAWISLLILFFQN